jgi:hypothetical protein
MVATRANLYCKFLLYNAGPPENRPQKRFNISESVVRKCADASKTAYIYAAENGSFKRLDESLTDEKFY